MIHRLILIILSILVTIFIGWTLRETGSYYITDLLERPHHDSHKLWKPGGTMGHGLGILGGSMMIIMFVYSLRKRIKFFQKWGKLPTWLNYHIFLGIVGPILVTLHTAFKFGGLVSISYWSMVAVALSGFIGRYIYIKIPHRVSGVELSKDEFLNRIRLLTEEMKVEFSMSDDNISLILDLSGAEKIEQRGLWGIFTIFIMDITGWVKWLGIKNKIQKTSAIPKSEIRKFKKSLRQIVKMNRQIAFWTAAHSLFHYWHVIHKPFAYTMVVIMFIHIVLVVSFGYKWIF
ncbi:MAG: hypothetical protein HOD97_06305 [Candidatus Marinimicrobia bacterium]|jgi:hypothetical protein|nr:hypothetical protein [Candidatus Neomarinimicrobiota bacterium]MBT3618480.1 hypothetical protein [Candidatus Neomarinimicrobiota bacterium]MBT3828886.1 hypothetical protein [Candidatus Neomarinimicrobiota bacterium]MBT3997270.1 hypothetical protein [Candidatus Neomarinimicrobiota bacterium]MBT4281208.1 hypothetical protein [Candidatus Neomarinimicrobiota bacterium]